jgi:glycosyltransferase involved in cell wall biosynthesis
MSLRIAQIATVDCSIQILLLDHIRSLREQGHDVTAVCAPGPSIKELRDGGVSVETVEMERELHPLSDSRSFVRLLRLFRQHRFDVVHTHTTKAGLLGPLAAQLAGVPVVLHTIHGLLFHDRTPVAKRGAFWLAEKFTASCTDHLLSQSREDVDVALQSGLCAPEKITYLGNGIDVQKFSPHRDARARDAVRRAFGFAETDFVVGSVSRLVYEKGCGDLFKAAQQLTSRYRDVKFLVVGRPEMGKSNSVPAEEIASLSQDRSIVFAGWRDDMPQCYSAMDAFLLPSHREGVPRACMGAAAMERAVIATDIRGCREAVCHRETGLLVPIRNVSAIVAAVEALLSDRSRARAMGRAGREHILRHHDQRQVLSRLCAFYAALDDERARQRLAA